MEFTDTLQSLDVLNTEAVDDVRGCLNYSTGTTFELLVNQLRREAKGKLPAGARVSRDAEDLRKFIGQPFRVCDLYDWLKARNGE